MGYKQSQNKIVDILKMIRKEQMEQQMWNWLISHLKWWETRNFRNEQCIKMRFWTFWMGPWSDLKWWYVILILFATVNEDDDNNEDEDMYLMSIHWNYCFVICGLFGCVCMFVQWSCCWHLNFKFLDSKSAHRTIRTNYQQFRSGHLVMALSNLIVIAFLVAILHCAPSDDLVSTVPRYKGNPVNFKTYSGYLNAKNGRLFYMLTVSLHWKR